MALCQTWSAQMPSPGFVGQPDPIIWTALMYQNTRSSRFLRAAVSPAAVYPAFFRLATTILPQQFTADKTLGKIKEHVYCKGMENDVQGYIKNHNKDDFSVICFWDLLKSVQTLLHVSVHPRASQKSDRC